MKTTVLRNFSHSDYKRLKTHISHCVEKAEVNAFISGELVKVHFTVSYRGAMFNPFPSNGKIRSVRPCMSNTSGLFIES